jgi:hypothetical protein
MREADVLEIAAVHGCGPDAGLRMALENSSAAYTLCINDVPEGYLGFTYDGGLAATVWMLGTPNLSLIARDLITEGRRISDAWTEQFTIQHNMVALHNEESQRWLKAIGFNVADRATPYGLAEEPFLYFWKARHV